jgi:biotin operon repressor
MERLAALFKALADPSRLRMVGLLVERERCGQELAGQLGLSAPTVSHHLRVLKEAGLLTESRQTPYTFYGLDLAALQKAVATIADKRQVQEFAAGGALTKEKRKVLQNFFDGTRLLSIPAQRRKREIAFEEVLRRLPRRKVYTERELSRFIEAIHPDFATIRREFIAFKYMEREKGLYRLSEKGRALIAQGR